jgi:hypothetical protein
VSELLERVKARKFFYRNYYRKAAGLLIIALALIVILSVSVVYVYLQRTIPAYYATSSDGKLVPLTPLNSPNYSNTPLIQ